MKKFYIRQDIKDKILTYSLSGIIIALFIIIVRNLSSIFGHIKHFLGVISPFLWGLLFAYLAKGIAEFIEDHLPYSWRSKVNRIISSVLAMLFILLCLSFVFIIIIPQLGSSVSSISTFFYGFVSYSGAIENFLVNYLGFSSSLSNAIVLGLNEWGVKFVQTITQLVPTIISTTLSTTADFIGNLFNFVLGFIIALFYLIERTTIKHAIERIAPKFFSRQQIYSFKRFYDTSVSKFYSYFRGSIIDSVLVGIECFILMSIFRLEFAGLISVIVAVTNIIPYFGPFIGGIPSFLLLLLTNPIHALIFAAIVIVVQQIDGNFIAPKIIGDSVGVPRLWCMFVIIVAGSYFGFLGMLFGVPIFSVVYLYVTEYLNNKKTSYK